MTPQKFRTLVFAYHTKEGRHALPWRQTQDPYHVLVSETMLQQTQVERVIPYYRTFIETFPTVTDLAKAPLSQVLRLWQGLGYNRRAKYLRDAAQAIVAHHGGIFPDTPEALQALPGIGPYTARAVCAFSFNTDVVCIETNIRTAVLHHFFCDKEQVSDAEILAILEKAFPKGRSREWYAALMDYGAHLKRTGKSLNAKSKTYTKQKPFKGSLREIRGNILRTLANAPQTKNSLRALFPEDRTQEVDAVLDALVAEGLLKRSKTKYALAD